MKRTKRTKKYFAGLLVCVLILSLLTVSGLDNSVASLGTVKATGGTFSGDGSAATPYLVEDWADLSYAWNTSTGHDSNDFIKHIRLSQNITMSSSLSLTRRSTARCA